MSCFCLLIISSGFDKCGEGMHCGDIVDYEIKRHPEHDSIPRKSIRHINDSEVKLPPVIIIELEIKTEPTAEGSCFSHHCLHFPIRNRA